MPVVPELQAAVEPPDKPDQREGMPPLMAVADDVEAAGHQDLGHQRDVEEEPNRSAHVGDDHFVQEERDFGPILHVDVHPVRHRNDLCKKAMMMLRALERSGMWDLPRSRG